MQREKMQNDQISFGQSLKIGSIALGYITSGKGIKNPCGNVCHNLWATV